MKRNTPFPLDILPYSAKESNWLSTAQMKRLYKYIVLSTMPITRVGQPDPAGRKTGRGGDPCAGERSDGGVRDLYREYAGGGGVKKQLSRRGFPGEPVR